MQHRLQRQVDGEDEVRVSDGQHLAGHGDPAQLDQLLEVAYAGA